MSPRARVVVAVIITGLLAVMMVTLIVSRVRHWQDRGIAGLVYAQVLSDGRAAPNVFPVKPGQILVVYPSGPADRAGIRAGGLITSIDGIALTDRQALRQLDGRLRAGDRVTYRIRHDGVDRAVTVQLGSVWPSALLVTSVTVYATVAAAFVLIGLLVFWRAPQDRRSTVFYAMLTIGAMGLLSSIVGSVDLGSLRGIVADPDPNLGIIAIISVFPLLFFPLTLHLALVFPKDRPSLVNNPYLLRWIYGAPATAAFVAGVFITVSIVALRDPDGDHRILDAFFKWGSAALAVAGSLVALRLARRGRETGIRRAFWFNPFQSLFAAMGLLTGLTRIFAALKIKSAAITMMMVTIGIVPLVVFVGYPILSCFLLYRSYRESGVEERRQVKWPLWGTLIAIGSKIVFSAVVFGITFTALAMGMDLSDWMPVTLSLQLVPIVLYLLIPISFAVAIFKYRLMNIDVIIKKTVVYAILSGAIIVLYLILVGGLGTLLVELVGVKNQTTVIAATLVVAVLFVPLRNRLQHLVDRNLFRQKIDYPQALRNIAAGALAATDSREFLSAAAEKLQQALQNRSVVIFQRRDEMMIATAKVGVADSILGSAAVSAATAESFDRPLDPRRRPVPEKDAGTLRRLDSTLIVPVRSQGTTTALVALGTKLSDQEFDLDDIEFASSAADHIGIGLDRIRVRYDEADFEQARLLQQGLMPAEPPNVAGIDVAGVWQPARTVGGDYYDFLKLSDTELALCIGDVAGKGMPAALLMSALQAAVRASADPDVPPNRVVERVRRVIVPSLAGRFVTFFYCTYDTATRRLRYCNAGHNPPIVVRADGSTVRLAEGGPILSRLFRDSALKEGRVELGSGDRLVLFTDGVSEARDAGAVDFGEERLEQLIGVNRHLPARELAAALVAAVASFAGGHPDDDLTLVTMAVS